MSKRNGFQKPGVTFNPTAADGFQTGVNKLVDIIRPTLGPSHGLVVNQNIGRELEFLDSGGTIARRIIQVPDRNEDVGLMHLRHVLWRLQEAVGDGTATCAVLFQEIYNQGRRYIAAGGNPMDLRSHFETGMRMVLSELDQLTMPIAGKLPLTNLAKTISHDEALSEILGEIFDTIGPFGQLEVRKGSGRELSRQFVEGIYWKRGLVSREMGNSAHGSRANLENAAILISDLEIESPEQLIPLLQVAVENNIQQLLLISQSLSESARGILFSKPNREKIFVAAVRTPGDTSEAQYERLSDLAILTGGRVFLKASADTLKHIRLEDLGGARRIWADTDNFGIIGGKGDPRTLRRHVALLRDTYQKIGDIDSRKDLIGRMGKLISGGCILYVGGLSPTLIEERVEVAKRTADAMRGALLEGVVPGGGLALLACQDRMHRQWQQVYDPDQRAAYRILMDALEAPIRTILTNSGLPPGKILSEIRHFGPGSGYDVVKGEIVNLREAGLLDPASVVKGAVRSAIASAALALTTETIIHRKNPPEVLHT